MNFEGKNHFRVMCLGVVLPIVIGLMMLQLGAEEHPPTAPSVGEETKPTVQELKPKPQITVLHKGQLQQMELEAYLLGVVLAEMPASFELDALRAQAVAARTYAQKHCQQDLRHGENVICSDYSCCQAYISAQEYVSAGGSWSSVERVRRAVTDTENLVLMYDGQLIVATYFSCAGGRTEDAVVVWGQDLPYLQSVASPGEEDATYFTDSKTFTAEQFQSALGIRLEGPLRSWFTDVTFTDGGGVDSMVIGGVRYRGTTLRTLLELRSTAFSVSYTEDTVTFHTRGYGHRVGMSQYGANAMAKEGKSFHQILMHYYAGTQIVHYTAITEKTAPKIG